MKIETITYGRVKNLGNYRSETFEATVTLEEEDHPETVADDLKAFVYAQLYPETKSSEDEPDPASDQLTDIINNFPEDED
jgi:hypothetical protein